MPTTVDAVYAIQEDPAGGNRLVPLYRDPVAAGFPSPADGYVERSIDLGEHLVPHPAATFVVRARGDSMIGAGIASGDMLVVDKALDPVDGDIVIAAVDGAFMVKRYALIKGRPVLLAENPRHPRLDIDAESEVEIWGVVTYVIHAARAAGGPRHGGHRAD